MQAQDWLDQNYFQGDRKSMLKSKKNIIDKISCCLGSRKKENKGKDKEEIELETILMKGITYNFTPTKYEDRN